MVYGSSSYLSQRFETDLRTWAHILLGWLDSIPGTITKAITLRHNRRLLQSRTKTRAIWMRTPPLSRFDSAKHRSKKCQSWKWIMNMNHVYVDMNWLYRDDYGINMNIIWTNVTTGGALWWPLRKCFDSAPSSHSRWSQQLSLESCLVSERD